MNKQNPETTDVVTEQSLKLPGLTDAPLHPDHPINERRDTQLTNEQTKIPAAVIEGMVSNISSIFTNWATPQDWTTTEPVTELGRMEK